MQNGFVPQSRQQPSTRLHAAATTLVLAGPRTAGRNIDTDSPIISLPSGEIFGHNRSHTINRKDE
jgi:hypothetical protein